MVSHSPKTGTQKPLHTPQLKYTVKNKSRIGYYESTTALNKFICFLVL